MTTFCLPPYQNHCRLNRSVVRKGIQSALPHINPAQNTNKFIFTRESKQFFFLFFPDMLAAQPNLSSHSVKV